MSSRSSVCPGPISFVVSSGSCTFQGQLWTMRECISLWGLQTASWGSWEQDTTFMAQLVLLDNCLPNLFPPYAPSSRCISIQRGQSEWCFLPNQLLIMFSTYCWCGCNIHDIIVLGLEGALFLYHPFLPSNSYKFLGQIQLEMRFSLSHFQFLYVRKSQKVLFMFCLLRFKCQSNLLYPWHIVSRWFDNGDILHTIGYFITLNIL